MHVDDLGAAWHLSNERERLIGAIEMFEKRRDKVGSLSIEYWYHPTDPNASGGWHSSKIGESVRRGQGEREFDLLCEAVLRSLHTRLGQVCDELARLDVCVPEWPEKPEPEERQIDVR